MELENEITYYKDCEYNIYVDEDPVDPREWDNLGTMATWHRRYSLGDFQPKERPEKFLRGKDIAVILPLYLYDHSGITISTKPFSCPWDSGQVGWIYAEKKAIRECFGVKYVTAKIRERVRRILVDEVKTYDCYLTGNVYGFIIEKDGELIERCGGYYTDDTGEIEEEVKRLIDTL